MPLSRFTQTETDISSPVLAQFGSLRLPKKRATLLRLHNIIRGEHAVRVANLANGFNTKYECLAVRLVENFS